MHNKKLNKIYQDLYHQACLKILGGDYSVDKNIDNALDQRFGITLLIRPQLEVKNTIQNFLKELKAIEPEQYYYPNSDLHITVLSIISCYVGFNLENISVDEYSKIISKSLESINEFEIEFKGITASESAIMIQGFPKDKTLNSIRENLRTHFYQSDLQQSMDKRYPLITAHLTVVRFKEKLKDVARFMNCIKKYKDDDFGISKVERLHLVYNDWYQREKKVQVLKEFKIG